MKVIVINKYRDKESNIIRKPGEIFEISQERFDEIQTVGNFLKEYPDVEKEGVQEEDTQEPLQESENEKEEPAKATKRKSTTKKSEEEK